MASFAVATTTALRPLEGGVRHWDKLFPWSSNKCALALSNYPEHSMRFFCSVSSGSKPGKSVIEASSENKPTPISYAWVDKQKPRVCILGGGFGGLYTALRLESLVWPSGKKPQVLLIDQSDRFVFKPLLYELLSGEVDAWEIAPCFSDLLANTSVQFFQDRIKELQPSDHLGLNISGSGGTVYLESGVAIEYDWLVLALGSEAQLNVVPGAAEFAVPFNSLEDAQRANNMLTTLERENFGKESSQINVTVVGCGYSGVELAATIAERLQNKGTVQAINVQNSICPTAPAGNREAAMKVISSRQVQLFLGYFVRCIKQEDKSQDMNVNNQIGGTENSDDIKRRKKLILELQPVERGLQSQVLKSDLVLWTVGSNPQVPPLEHDKFGVFPLNVKGQVETDETLRIKGHPRIFAIGDSSSLRDSSGRLLPATAQVALQQADFTGWNLWAAITDKPLLPFRFQNLGEMMTLGRNDAAVTPNFIEGLTLDGDIGHIARKIAYLYRLPTDEHRIKVGISWFMKSALDSIASFQTTIAKVLSD